MHSKRNTLIVCAAGGLTEPIGRWIEQLEPAWDAWEQAPGLIVTSIAGLGEAMGERPAEYGGVLAVIHDGADPGEVRRLGTHARRTNAPVIALVETVTPERAALRADGVIVRRWDESAERLAATISTLRDRQMIVRRLAGEVIEAWDARPVGGGADDASTRRLAGTVQRAQAGRTSSVPGVELATSRAPSEGVCPWVCLAGQLDMNQVRFALAEVDADDARGALTMMLLTRLLEHDLQYVDQVAPYHPARALGTINARLAGTDVRAVSLVYGVLDTISGETTIGAAGTDVLRVPVNGAAEQIEATGPRVGIDRHADFGERVLTLEPGEVLVLGAGGSRELGAIAARVDPLDPLGRTLDPDDPGGVMLVRRRALAIKGAA